MRTETLMKRVTNAAKCVDMFAHHEWMDSVEVTIRGRTYTGVRCDCGYIQITSN